MPRAILRRIRRERVLVHLSLVVTIVVLAWMAVTWHGYLDERAAQAAAQAAQFERIIDDMQSLVEDQERRAVEARIAGDQRALDVLECVAGLLLIMPGERTDDKVTKVCPPDLINSARERLAP